MAKVGRPSKLNDCDIQETIKKFEKYIDETPIPIVAEFAYQNKILRETLYDYKEFSTVLKACIDKKTAQLEKAGLANKVNVGMAIFSLKQLGWSDKVMTETPSTESFISKFNSEKEQI